MSFTSLIENCENLIRSGQAKEATRLLSKINPAKVPRQWRLPLANLSRRTGQFSLGLTLLARIANPTRPSIQPTSAELAEYSVLLLRCGATNEAIATLGRVDYKVTPSAFLYESFCRMTRWEMDAAVPLLEHYLQTDLNPYARLVGRANLAYVYVESARDKEALALLGEDIRVTEENRHLSLMSNCLGLRARLHMRRGDYGLAKADLDTASSVIGDSQSNDQFYIAKWRAVLKALESRSTSELEGLRPLAVKYTDWEMLREADFYWLKIGFDKARYLHLLFGTPFPAFRARICDELGVMPDRDVYVFGKKNVPRFDLFTGQVGENELLKPGSKVHQMLQILLYDFYRPLRVGGLFSELFPGEHFDVYSSPDRVHQVLRRMRRWYESEKIPINVRAKGGFYSLDFADDFSFRLKLDRMADAPVDLRLKRLSSLYQDKGIFSAREACDKLNVTKRVLQQVLKKGVETGKIERLGASAHSARYKVAA